MEFITRSGMVVATAVGVLLALALILLVLSLHIQQLGLRVHALDRHFYTWRDKYRQLVDEQLEFQAALRAEREHVAQLLRKIERLGLAEGGTATGRIMANPAKPDARHCRRDTAGEI